MDQYSFDGLVKYEECNECEHKYMSEHMTTRLVWLLACLAYLRVPRQPSPPEVSTLRLLIVVVGLVLVVVALVAVGADDQVSNVLRHWPLIP